MSKDQANELWPMAVPEFDQMINERAKGTAGKVISMAPGMETVPENIPAPTGEGSIASGVVGAARSVGGAISTGYNQIAKPNVESGEEALLRGGLGPVVPSTPNIGSGGGASNAAYIGPMPWRVLSEIVPIGDQVQTATETQGVVPVSAQMPMRREQKEGETLTVGREAPAGGEGPMQFTVSSPGTGGGVVPTNAPMGGGVQGFVDTEMQRIEKDRAEYAAYRRQKEEEQLAGLGEAGQDRLKQRMAAMAPYLQGVSRRRQAQIMSGIVGEHFKSEDEMRKALLMGRMGAEASTTAATIRSGSVREAAIMRANTEAQKMGIDVAKLGLEQQKLGLQAGNIQSEMKLREATINDMMVKSGQIEPMKLALSETKNADERTKVQREFWNNANTTAFKETLAGIKAKYQYTPDSPEAAKETQDAYQKFTSGFEAGTIRFPFRGEVWNGFVYDGSKWVKQNTQ